MKVAVDIPAYNEAAHIAACLQSLVGQRGSQPFDVIVVDNGSTDATAQIAHTFADRLSLTVISEPTPGRGAARARGFASTTADIVCSTDSDTVVPADWVERMATSLAESPCIALSGSCRIQDCSPQINRRFNLLQPRLMHVYRLVFRHYWLTGSNCVIRMPAYRAAGGFSPLDRDLEDIEFGFRLQKVGTIGYIDSVYVTTSGKRFSKGLMSGLWPYIKIFMAKFWLRHNAYRSK